MRFHYAFLAVVGCGVIAACGGGGGGGSSPTPAPTNNSYRPAAAGDAFSFSGTSSTLFVRPPATGAVIPSPNPANTETLSYTTTQSQTVAGDSTYNGIAGAYAFTTSQSDTLLGGLATTTSTNVEYYSYLPSGKSTVVRDLGGTTTDSGGNRISTVFGATNGLLDILPEAVGTLAPANDASLVINEYDADGQTDARTTNSDGTFTETIAYPDGTSANATANADGSGSFSFPLEGSGNASFVVGAPSAGAIPITITYPAGLITTPNATPTPTVVVATVGVWYPQPIVLATQTQVISAAAIPGACNVPSSLQRKNPHDVVSTTSTVDPIFGELDTLAVNTYTEPGVGVACVVSQDVLQQYYDFSLQSGQFVTTSSSPVQTTTSTQTLGVTSETVIGLTSVARAPALAASAARFKAMLERRTLERHANAVRALRTFSLRMHGGR